MHNIEKEFIDALGKLHGIICWDIGDSVGSIISLNFGKKMKIPKGKPFKFQNRLLGTKQLYKGEYSFLIYCAWRLEAPNKVICGWDEYSKKWVKQLQRLVDSKVDNIEISSPSYDLSIYFSNSLCLKVFCDQTTDNYENYSFYTPNKVYSVEEKSKLEIEIGN